MSDLTISHSPRQGTLVEGTVKGDGAHSILNRRQWGPNLAQRFKFSRYIDAWYLPQSRDNRSARYRHTIDRLATELRAAGHTVTVEINDQDRRSVAEREADAAERAEGRVERFGTYAGNAAGRSEALFEEADRMREAIPLGQPMMPDHYSYNRDRNFRDRMHRKDEKGIAESKKARYWNNREQAARHYADHRFDPYVALGRIERLTRERRTLELALEGRGSIGGDHTDPDTSAEWQARAKELTEQIDYWREQVDQSGVKVWSASDFRAGDFAEIRGQWYEVLRANAKTVSVPSILNVGLPVVTRRNNAYRGMRNTVEYRKVSGRMSAEEMNAKLHQAQEEAKKQQG
jgi:hypothetical protein